MTDPIVNEEQMPTDEPTADEPMANEAETMAPTEQPETEPMAPMANEAEPTEAAAAPEATATDVEPTATDVEPMAAPETAAATDPEAIAEPSTSEAAQPASSETTVEPAAPAEAEAAPQAAARPARKGRATAEPGVEDRKAAAAAQPDVEEAPAPPRRPVLEGPKPLRVRYQTEVIPALVKQFEYANPNQVPKLEKIVVNVGLGEALANAKAIDAAAGDLTMITGQKPIVTKARRSIAQFKIRTGNPIGLKVTLRGPRMWDFLERLLLLTLPRIRDFRGTPSRSFDGRGNYSLGMREQIAFPEIDYDKVDRLRGLEVSIVTTAKSDEESKRLLELLGMPFAS